MSEDASCIAKICLELILLFKKNHNDDTLKLLNKKD